MFLWDCGLVRGVGSDDSPSIWAGLCERAEAQGKTPPAYTTVMTHLKRLVLRGLVKRAGPRRQYMFEAIVSREEYQGWLQEERLNRLVLPALKRLMASVGMEDVIRAIETLGYRVTPEAEPSPRTGE